MANDLIILLIGQAPPGYENLQYVTATIIGLFAIKFILEMFIHVFNLILRFNRK